MHMHIYNLTYLQGWVCVCTWDMCYCEPPLWQY